MGDIANDPRGTVLIVEDDLLLSMVEERLISTLGFQVIGKVTTGEEAIQKVAELTPDIIIMDILLKGPMNGIEAMKAIRKQSEVPVIYLSGSADESYLDSARETNFTGYLTKPVTLEDLKRPLMELAASRNLLTGNSPKS